MKHVFLTRAAALLLACVLALTFVGCGKGTADSTASSDAGELTAEWTHVGEGNCAFSFIATFADGTTQSYVVNTDKDTVGTALLDAGLIEGEQSAYGLYVKSVCGVVATIMSMRPTGRCMSTARCRRSAWTASNARMSRVLNSAWRSKRSRMTGLPKGVRNA